MKKLFVLGLAVAAMSAALAMPTLFGPNGAFILPTAEVQQGTSVSFDMIDAMSYGFEYPFTKVVTGIGNNIEVGGSYIAFSDMGDGGNYWDVFGKITLPYDVVKGKIAVGMLYASGEDDFDGWAGTLTGTWPVFSGASFTAGAILSNFSDREQTSYGTALEVPIENVTVGIEWLWNFSDLDFGTIYANIPMNKKLNGRVALTGLGESTLFDFGAEMKF